MDPVMKMPDERETVRSGLGAVTSHGIDSSQYAAHKFIYMHALYVGPPYLLSPQMRGWDKSYILKRAARFISLTRDFNERS